MTEETLVSCVGCNRSMFGIECRGLCYKHPNKWVLSSNGYYSVLVEYDPEPLKNAFEELLVRLGGMKSMDAKKLSKAIEAIPNDCDSLEAAIDIAIKEYEKMREEK